jgi:hypothetical protein
MAKPTNNKEHEEEFYSEDSEVHIFILSFFYRFESGFLEDSIIACFTRCAVLKTSFLFAYKQNEFISIQFQSKKALFFFFERV